jgi:hypothetical protein
MGPWSGLVGDWDDMMIHRVRIERQSTTEGEYSSDVAFATVADDVMCRIEGVSASEDATPLETEVTTHNAYFNRDWGLSYLDRLIWGSRILTIDGASDQGGGSEVWMARCVERKRRP